MEKYLREIIQRMQIWWLQAWEQGQKTKHSKEGII